MATPILLVRALYDFNSTDGSSLSFRRDDIIEVLTQLESGWWDGICRSERGWFPSNYVTPIDDEDDPLEDDDQSDYVMHSDWVAQATPDGAVFYRNTRTGETSWEVPADDNESVTTTLSATTRDASSVRDGSVSYRSANSRSGSVSAGLPVRQQQLPKNWIMQPTEDGNTYYYRNIMTNEIRWTHPGGGSGSHTGAGPSGNGIASGSDIDDEHDIDAPVSRVEEEVADQDGDVEAAEKESIASSRGSGLSTSTIGTQRQKHLANGVERLPPNWGRKTTPQGRTYYYNVSTDETTWSLENIDMDTGRLIKAEQPVDESMPDVDDVSDLGGGPAAFSPSSRKLSTSSMLIVQNPDEPLTWDSLSRNVQVAIDQLNEAARCNDKSNYADGTNAIVESIRIMLYASGTVEKESPAIRQDKDLKIYHRHIMASLSKLVLSTKVASSVWPPPDATQKMESDAKEVSVAVQQFVRAAEHTVDIKRVDPKILECAVGGSWRGNNLPNATTNGNASIKSSSGPSAISPDGDSQPSSPIGHVPGRSLTPDLLASLDHSSRTVSKAITLLVNHVRKAMDAPRGSLANSAAFAPQLITQTRQVVTQVGQFLQLVEDINLEDLEESSQDTIAEFKVAKQALYNNIAGLVICTQSATDPLAPQNAMEQVLVSTNVVDKSIKDMIVACKFLVEEKDTQDQRIIQSNMKRRGSGDTLGHDTPVEEPQPLGPNMMTGLISVPEHAEIEISTTNRVNRDPGTADDDFAPMSPISDGSSTVTAAPSYTQTVATSSASADYPFPPSPPLTATPSGAKKIKKFFGDEAPATQVTRPREDRPWYLNYNYDASELVFNMEGVVKGGTLNALVERLTLHDSFDFNFIATFLLTYRSFTTSEELFEKLVERFTIKPPDGLTPEENEAWVEKKQTFVRIRVFSVMKSWLENYYITEDDSSVLDKMHEFAKTIMDQVMPTQALSLIKVIEKRQQLSKAATFKELIPTPAQQPPQPILPKNMKKLKFLDLDALEIARQLTIIESLLYAKIGPVECLNKAWSKETGGEIAENIKAMIYNSNQITGWVAESILNQQEIKKRCALIKHFVAIADKCRVLNNFNSLTAMISGLNSAPIHRLKRTWEMINARTIQTLENLNKIMNSTKNFADYRDMLHSVNPPCVPFLGVYLTDLTFIEDGNPNTLKKSRNLINFSKRTKTAEVIREIQQYQAVPYHLIPVPEIQIFIKSHLQDSRDVGDLYDQSLSMEPREREDEKIARLLQESGFL